MTTFTTSKEWLIKAKSQLKQCTEKRLYDRMNKIEQVINSILPSHITSFAIDESLKQQICFQVSNAIDKYEGTKKLKINQETSLEDVIKKTRTWWNRTKSTKLGSVLFTVICFYVLHNFIKQQCSDYSSPKHVKLFIDIFISFMDETIRFPKTKPKSLIPHQCFLAQSEFRNICSEFVKIFGDENIKCDLHIKKIGPIVKDGKKIYEYIKEKNRSANLFNDFKHCLQQIKAKISVEFDNELMDKWDDIIHKFRPKDYQLSFRSITPVNRKIIPAFDDNIPHINTNNICNYHCNNCDNIPENGIIANNCNNIHSMNSNNYYCDKISPSLSTDYEYVQYDTNNSYNNNPCVSYKHGTQYNQYFEPQILYNEHNVHVPCDNSLVHGHRQFQSTNQFCAPLNRVHRNNGNENIMRNSVAEMRNKRREQHIELMHNGFNNNISSYNSQYLCNDNNTISDVSSINASNGNLSQNSFSLFPDHISDNHNIVSDNVMDKDINTVNIMYTFDNNTNNNTYFFDDNSIIQNPFEEDDFVNHII